MYTVWVGGSEITNSHVSQGVAEGICELWLALGYDDVVIEEVTV